MCLQETHLCDRDMDIDPKGCYLILVCEIFHLRKIDHQVVLKPNFFLSGLGLSSDSQLAQLNAPIGLWEIKYRLWLSPNKYYKSLSNVLLPNVAAFLMLLLINTLHFKKCDRQ